MTSRPALAFACAHMTEERLYAHQLAALDAACDCRAFVFREHDSMADMAAQVLGVMPERFTLIGLSLGGYVAFEVVRRALPRLERLVLIDTTAVADHPARREAVGWLRCETRNSAASRDRPRPGLAAARRSSCSHGTKDRADGVTVADRLL